MTWGNACARGCVPPFSLTKPPRSSGGPITIAWLSRLLRYRFCASPRCGRGRVSFVSPGRRPRGFFRPSPSRWLLSPGLAIPRMAISVRIRSSSCCRLRPGSSLDAMVGSSSPSTELASLARTPPVVLAFSARACCPLLSSFRLGPSRCAALLFRTPSPARLRLPEPAARQAGSFHPNPVLSPNSSAWTALAVVASLANVECAVQREFAQDVLLNRIGLGKGPFPFAVRGYGGSGMLEADRVVDLLRAERDHADSK